MSGPETPPTGSDAPADGWAPNVSRLARPDAPDGATNINVGGRRVAGPVQGFGKLWRKRYRVAIGEQAEPGAVGENPEVRVGDQDALAEVVPQPVHHAEHHDQGRDADGDTAGGDDGVERGGAGAAAS